MYLQSRPEKALSLFFFLALSGFVKGQEIFDLSRCITTGLKNNYGISIVRNQEEISSNNFTRGNAGSLPTVGLSGSYGGTLNTTNQSLREGGETNSKGIYNTSGSAGVNLDLTIFNGFKVQATYHKLAELNQLGELNTQMALENLVSDIAAEYFYYIEQVNLYKNLAYAVALSRERVRIDEQRYLLGASSKLQLLQSIVYLNADSSRFAGQNEVLRTSQIRLNKLMTTEDIGSSVTLRDTLIRINENLLYPELLKLTRTFNTSLKIAAKNQTISELDYKIIASKAYPYLTVSSGYALSRNDYETSTLKNQQIHGMNYGLTMGIDLFDGFNRKREKTNSRIDVENRKYQYKEVEQEVMADLISIFYAYENNLRLLRLEEQNLAVARENLEIALERYKLGNLSGIELREVQKSLLDAEERLISVQYLAKIAEISLFQISGKIMDYI
jgi:outer membrane protein TolC